MQRTLLNILFFIFLVATGFGFWWKFGRTVGLEDQSFKTEIDFLQSLETKSLSTLGLEITQIGVPLKGKLDNSLSGKKIQTGSAGEEGVNDSSNLKEVRRPLFKDGSTFHIIHFWATWCGPCVTELPSLGMFSSRFRDANIVAISQDSSSVEVVKFVSMFDEIKASNILLALDHDQILAGRFFVDRLPQTYVFDRQGLFKKKLVGAVEWNSPEVIKYFEDNFK